MAVSRPGHAPATLEERWAASWRASRPGVRGLFLAAMVLSCLLPFAGVATFPMGVATFPVGVALAVCGALAAAAAVIDVHELRLPNALSATVAMVALAGAAATGMELLVRSATGGLLAGALLLGVHLTRGVGLGDVKMGAALGAAAGMVGWLAPAVAVAATAALAALVGAVTRRARLPLGPALWCGWAVAVVAAGQRWPA